MLRLNLPQKSISQPIWNPALADVALMSRAPALCSPARSTSAGGLLNLRVERAAGDAELGARFHDAKTGGAHVRIRALRLGNQLVEHRVVEVAPPLLHLRALRGPRGSTASDSSEPPVQSSSQAALEGA